MGLVKHATFVEKVWFDEAVTCRPRAEIGIPANPDESFVLNDTDTIATVRRAHRQACEASRRTTLSMGLDDLVHGNRRGPLPLRWVYLHVLRELAQHCGHADILREQLSNEYREHPLVGVRRSGSGDGRRRSWCRWHGDRFLDLFVSVEDVRHLDERLVDRSRRRRPPVPARPRLRYERRWRRIPGSIDFWPAPDDG